MHMFLKSSLTQYIEELLSLPQLARGFGLERGTPTSHFVGVRGRAHGGEGHSVSGWEMKGEPFLGRGNWGKSLGRTVAAEN